MCVFYVIIIRNGDYSHAQLFRFFSMIERDCVLFEVENEYLYFLFCEVMKKAVNSHVQ